MANSEVNSNPLLHNRNFRLTTEELNMFLEGIQGGKSQVNVVPRTTLKQDGKESTATAQKSSIKGETSSYMSTYLNLPQHFKSCLDYCCFAIGKYGRRKSVLAQLLKAEGFVQDNVMAGKALRIVDELNSLGMLVYNPFILNVLLVPSSYRELCDEGVDGKDFAADSPIRLCILDDGTNNLPSNLNTLPITSLFFYKGESQDLRNNIEKAWFSGAYIKTICKLKSLVVLDLDGDIEYLPDEIGDLVHLRFLSLFGSFLKELPTTIGKLQNLQTLHLRKLGFQQLPDVLFEIQSLRHLIVFGFRGYIRVPRKIGEMKNLQTLSCVYAGEGIAEELSKLTQLRELEVYRVSEDHVTELSASIMRLTNLIYLSMTTEETLIELEYGQFQQVSSFPEMETFSPLPQLQEVSLVGQMIEMPRWLVSMQNLTNLFLWDSHLLDNPTSEIQFLPKLKHLTLWNAFKVKCIGEEFCEPGGFPSLVTLVICSEVLVEWTKIANGAFPSLKTLTISYCDNFRFFPDGLENISTLKNLIMFHVYGDLIRRLQGEDSYKIKNIPNVQFGYS